MQFRFGLKEKILFYLDYFFRKVFSIWIEVKRPKFKMFFYEMIYSIKKIFNYESMYLSPFADDVVETKFGKFRIRPYTVDISNASPAFERRDISALLKILKELVRQNKKILFLDIGADIGTFTVTIGNSFKDYKDLKIISFEPSPSFELLKENILINSLKDKAVPLNFALGENEGTMEIIFNPSVPGSSGKGLKRENSQVIKVPVKTLDSIIEPNGLDAIIIKMDVEGMEEEILRGAKRLLTLKREIYLLVEDFIKPSIVDYLEGIGAVFLKKLTPYNSFWVIK